MYIYIYIYMQVNHYKKTIHFERLYVYITRNLCME